MVGRPDLLEDSRFSDDILRGTNGEALSATMQEWCKTMSLEECLATLAEWNVAASPILSPAQIVGGSMGLLEGFMELTDYPGTDGVPIARAPFRFAGHPKAEIRSPPTLGQHTREVYAELGFDSAEIDALKAQGVI
jgi:formyl-CoA transferase